MNESRTPVAYAFDRMAADYDDLRDLWYAWLFSRLHYFLAAEIDRLWEPGEQRVLDVGCGTGFQSFLYAAVGSEVVGIDVAAELIAVAQRKIPAFLRSNDFALFPAHHAFVTRYDRKIAARLRKKFPEATRRAPQFQIGDALSIELPDAAFTHVNCCGSVLSLIDDPGRALDEIARVLRPGGTFFFEVESRWNGDAFWPLVDKLLGGVLHYKATWKEATALLNRPSGENVRVEYPFGEDEDPVYMDLNLFTRRSLQKMLRERGLIPARWRTIHSFTNLLPSTVLDSANPSALIKNLFAALRMAEQFFPVSAPGCSLVVSGTRGAVTSI